MQAEIITIGDEILIGQTVDTNSAWIGEKFNALGIKIHRITSVSDVSAEITKALDEALLRSQLIIITGGLGPTKDDLTKHTLASYFGGELVMHEPTLERISAFFAHRGLPMLETNRQQALMPSTCEILPNMRGTANGMWFAKNDAVVVSLPGVPHEMKGLMEEEVIPRVMRHFERNAILHRTLLTVGVGESFLADKIKEWEDSLASVKIKLAYLPSPGLVKLRMSAYDVVDPAEMEKVFDQKEKELRSIIGEHIFGANNDTLGSVIGALLIERGEKLAVAESCTGGELSGQITAVAGASEYFDGGLVCYHAQAKVRLLGVEQSLIDKHGVVSSQVAMAMAEGVKRKFDVHWALATTGIAGPGGGTAEIPVGTVWIAVSGPTGTHAKLLKLGRMRDRNIAMAAYAALNLLRTEILKNNP
jgi:nicotinamide-nucleotide amidase